MSHQGRLQIYFLLLLIIIISKLSKICESWRINRLQVFFLKERKRIVTITRSAAAVVVRPMEIEEIGNLFLAKKQGIKFDQISENPWVEYIKSNGTFSNGLRGSLLTWYLANRRRMPWRGDDTDIPVSPYGVWISEVMLQQTRVETVIAYWNRWMNKYPSIEALSKASPDEVNSLWSGLGYYRRAQNLLLGAKFIMEKCNGLIPSNKKQLLEVPGIGLYTAGAILSIAYQQQEPLVDGNVLRVFSRLFCLQEESGSTNGPLEKLCWKLAENLISTEAQPHYYNQALMELGATICKPTNPDCGQCPVRQYCKAKELIALKATDKQRFELIPEDVTYFPLKKAKKKQKEIQLLVYVVVAEEVQSDGTLVKKFLLFKRPEKGLLANQWEFPNISFESLQTVIAIESIEGEGNDDNIGEDIDKAVESTTIDISTVIRDNRKNISAFFQERCAANFINAETQPVTTSNKTSDYVSASIKFLFESKEAISLPTPIIHIFSHERHTMYLHIDQINLIQLDETNQAAEDHTWKTAEEMKEMGITAGCKKILEKVEKEIFQAIGNKRKASSVLKKDHHPPENVFEIMKKSITVANLKDAKKGKKKSKKV